MKLPQACVQALLASIFDGSPSPGGSTASTQASPRTVLPSMHPSDPPNSGKEQQASFGWGPMLRRISLSLSLRTSVAIEDEL